MIAAAELSDHNGALRAHTDWRRFIAANIDGLAEGWLEDRMKYGHAATVPSAAAFSRMVEDSVSADVCWMSHEMMDLVQHAMDGFDPSEPFVDTDAFIPHGFMVLPEPFHSRDRKGMKIAHRAYLWRYDPWGVVEVPNGEGVDTNYDVSTVGRYDGGYLAPCVRMTTLSHIDDDDDYSGDGWLEVLRDRGWSWGILHTTSIPLRLMSDLRETSGEGDRAASWLTFWRVAQKLMSETIVTSERRPALRSFRREAQRFGFEPHAPRVIELRRPRKHSSDPEGAVRSVEWTHRWIVRGHWRNQFYPSLNGNRQKWIGAYEKGPDDLPLVIRERVWNWDR